MDEVSEASEASLPNHIRHTGPYNVSSTETGFWIQHHFVPSNIWVDARDIDGIIEAIESLRK